MNRAYSVLQVKEFAPSGRKFSGIATTPEPDRVGDVIDPLGVTFKNPLALLLFHNSTQPVGTVEFGRPTKVGVPFTAEIPEVTEDGEVKSLTDKAAHFVKYGLIRAVSIGFRPIEDAIERLKDGGIKFLKTEVLELSLVPIPANEQAVITTIKSICAQEPAASGTGLEPVARPSARGRAPVKLASAKAPMKTIQDQIQDFRNTRASKDAERTALMTKAAEAGETLDAANAETYDTLTSDIESIDAHLKRLDALAMSNKAAAVEVKGTTVVEAAASRGGHAIQVKSHLPPGIEFARMVMCKVHARLDGMSAIEVAKARYPDNPRIHLYFKAALGAGTTTDSTSYAPLVDQTNLASEFIEFLRPQTIVGRIPGLRRVPFNIRVVGQTTGASASWVGQGAPKPLTDFNVEATTLLYTKIAAIAVITEELARFSSPSAEGIVRDELARAVIARMDTDFINPDIAAVAGVNPASITNGITALTSAGTSADNARTDVTNLLEQFILNNVNPTNLVLIMPNTLALALSILVNSLGQREFPDLNMNGGSLLGIPVVTSQYAASSGANGNMVIALNASDIFLADDGQVTVDMSREASLQMDTAPTVNSATPTATSLVSMFQTNSIAIRAERYINWARRRTAAVSWMDDVTWGAAGSPA